MASTCAITECKRKSVATCHCCKENLCLNHLKDHQDLLISQLNPLADRINTVGDRLKTFNVNQASKNCRQKLNEWRDACRKMIDRVYEEKCHEIDECFTEKIDKHRNDIAETHSRLSEMISEQEVTREDLTFVTTAIVDLEKVMNNIEQIFFKLETKPLVVDESFIHIKGSNMNKFDVSALQSPKYVIDCPKESSPVLASNTRFLLIHKESQLYLINQELKIVKKHPWSHGKIYSMCWSSALARFVVNGSGSLLLVDERTLTVENMPINQVQKWGSYTCSDTKFYITTWESGPSIFEYNLLPPIQLIKQWQPPITCSEQEMIHDINYHNNTLALLIKDKPNKTISMELRSSVTLERLWAYDLNIKSTRIFKFYLCSLSHNGWLVIDYEDQRLLQINKEGKLKGFYPYDLRPKCAVLFALLNSLL